MKNIKVPGWMLSFVLIFSMALPCMFATAEDMEETESVFSDNTVQETEQEQEIPVEETEQEQETPAEEVEQEQEISIVLEEATDEESASLTDEENMEIGAYIESFEQAPLPPVVITKFDDEPVASEIIYPTVSFTRVAPFGMPVTGGENEGGRG